MEYSVVTQCRAGCHWCRPAAPRGDTHTAGIFTLLVPSLKHREEASVSAAAPHSHLWQRCRCPTVSSLQTHNVKSADDMKVLGRRPVWAPRSPHWPSCQQWPDWLTGSGCTGGRRRRRRLTREHHYTPGPNTEAAGKSIAANRHTHTHIHTSGEILTILQMEAMFLTVI